MAEPTPMWIQFLLASVPSLFAFVTFYFFQRRSDDKRFELERERFQHEQKRWRTEYLLERKVDEIEKVNKAVRIMVNNVGYAYKVVNDLDREKASAKSKELTKKEAKAAADEVSGIMAQASLYLRPEVAEKVRELWQESVLFYYWALPTRNEKNASDALMIIMRKAEVCYKAFREEVQCQGNGVEQ
jgi:hypothetical protein